MLKDIQRVQFQASLRYPHPPQRLILPAGDLLRAEQENPDSKHGELIKQYIKDGLIVPMEITIALLKAAIETSGGPKFLVVSLPHFFYTPLRLGCVKQIRLRYDEEL